MTNTTSNAEHLFISDLRRHPAEEVRLLVGRRLVSGTRPGGVIASIEEMIREAKEVAWAEGERTGRSRAMRHMSDEPNLSLAADNPYSATK